jgi:hypothetical protein
MIGLLLILGKKRQIPFIFLNEGIKKTYEINHGDIQIVQYSNVIYLGCILDSYMSRKAMATK